MSERSDIRGASEDQSPGQIDLERTARGAIESVGYDVASVSYIAEGRSHNNFDVILRDGSSVIARFEKPQVIESVDGERRDFHFNGPLSLERERNIMELVRVMGLPAPQVYGLFRTDFGSFLAVEKMPGIYWSEFMEQNNYSLEAYLRSLRYLGVDVARMHQIKFDSFGDVLGKDRVHPGNIHNFVDRVEMITELKLQRAKLAGVLNDQELNDVGEYLQAGLASLNEMMRYAPQQPSLIFTDLHPMNFFVDGQGKPSGYFDFEFCQAGLPALEIYNLRTTILNYFEGTSKQAEEAFLNGYKETGEVYDSQNPINRKLERVLSVGWLLAAATTYYGASDGLRDAWSGQFKTLLFDALGREFVDFAAISGVFRSKTGQPKFPR